MRFKQRWAMLVLKFADWMESLVVKTADSSGTTKSKVLAAKYQQQAKKIKQEIRKDLD